MAKSEQMFERVRKVRVSDTVVEQIKSIISSGALEVGDQLPSERELIDQLHLSRASVREALRILEYEGVIEVRPGKGSFVISDARHDSDEVAVRRWFREHSSEVLDTLEVRDALERRGARLAAVQSTPEQITQLHRNIETTEECVAAHDLDKLVQLDREFHRLLARASGIPLLSELVDFAVHAMVSPRRSLLRLSGNPEKSLGDHKQILSAVSTGDPDAAEKALAHHTSRVRHSIIAMMENTQN